MLIAGAKGFAKEVFELIYSTNQQAHLAFFDNVSTNLPRTSMGDTRCCKPKKKPGSG
ncbi:hypothetical protein [Hymenobacter volaticus]|uniref:Uncharacterized protein n=1 Tax=Hymenobacter volaticus TaxID=2932254 RepID=A0ABY4GDT0_9BACT|nr:hypothetical protein [Hymenobacter volaticus]UOQ68951.1 hypothetical protein MUN86_24925 [Hymenobacter volaticus]